jgi:hypothetical protein
VDAIVFWCSLIGRWNFWNVEKEKKEKYLIKLRE